MKVVRASCLGFCFGVKRAVDSVEALLANKSGESSNSSVYIFGELIHNNEVLDDFKARGVEQLAEGDIERVDEGSAVVIRAHGVTQNVMTALKEKGASVVDSTCPKVKLSQRLAKETSDSGGAVFLAGDANHGEVLGIASYAENAFVLLDSVEAAREWVASHSDDLITKRNAVFLSQTTFSTEAAEAIYFTLKSAIPSLKKYDTICHATRERQDALIALSEAVDGILVIGGAQSANTRRLYDSALRLVKTCALIENYRSIPEEFFALETVGITAGASTPDHLITEVEEELIRRSKSR